MYPRRLVSNMFLMVTLCFTTSCLQEDPFYTNVLRSDVFHQLYDDSYYDFLWVFDNSDSMKDKRDYIKDRMQTFLNILNGRKAIDYWMAMTTTDYFSHQGILVQSPGGLEVVKSSSSDPVGDFAAIVNNVQNTATSFWEQGLESSYHAVNDWGSKFMRPDVPLVVIFVTDEESYDCKSNCVGVEPENNLNWIAHPMSRYTDFFNNLRSDSRDVLIFPIVGTSTSTCTLASLGQRYIDLQVTLGTGQSGSICTAELPDTYSNIAKFISDRGVRFSLSKTSSGSGIRVYVNSVFIPYSDENGFVYESSTNSIVFTGSAIPKKGSIIEVVYKEKQS